MELAIHAEEPLLNLQIPTTELDPTILLPTHVKLLHWIFIAQGSRWPRLQLITTYGLYVAWMGYYEFPAYYVPWRRNWDDGDDLVATFITVLVELETIVNAFLCYELCKHDRVQRLIIWANSQQSQDTTSPVASLRKVAWGGWAACLFLGAVFNFNYAGQRLLCGYKDWEYCVSNSRIWTDVLPMPPLALDELGSSHCSTALGAISVGC
jgi:hypothetical protein